MAKVVLITGARKGIGRELSIHYLLKGYTVIGCSRGESDLEDENYKHFCLDVSDEKSVVKMVRGVKKEFGAIDILINNAGVASMNHFLTTSTSSVSKVFETNFLGAFIVSREVSKVMMKQKKGRIVNFTTVASALRLEGEAIYAASKSAVENFTQTIAKELSAYNITVNAIGPTPIETDLIKTVPKDKLDELLEKQSIKRFGTFEDVKNVVDFFVDDRSDFITAQVVYLGGVVS